MYEFSWDKLLDDLEKWQRHQFPLASPESAIAHIEKEIKELKADPHNLEEWADLMHLAWQGFWKAAMGQGLSPYLIMREKFEANKKRSWQAPDAENVYEHVRSGEVKPRPFGFFGTDADPHS